MRVFSQALVDKVEAKLGNAGAVKTVLAMRYGEPSIVNTIDCLAAANARRLLVLPLYPQYSATTTGAVFDAVTSALQRLRWPPELRFINDYHDDAQYISALAQRVESYWSEHGRGQHLLLSFHGIPQRYVHAGDPYFDQCRTTTRLLRERLGMGEDECGVSFQSRVGRELWLKPYTDEVLSQMPRKGLRHVQVLCPGFAVDCLETLEEIAIRYKEQFIAAGGERLDYIPALNATDMHLRVLTGLIARHTGGWPKFSTMTAE